MREFESIPRRQYEGPYGKSLQRSQGSGSFEKVSRWWGPNRAPSPEVGRKRKKVVMVTEPVTRGINSFVSVVDTLRSVARGSCTSVVDTHRPVARGSCTPVVDALHPVKGSPTPVVDALYPVKGSPTPVVDTLHPVRGSPTPVWHTPLSSSDW